MTITIAVYLGLHFLRSYLSYLMYTADPQSDKIAPLSFSVIAIEFICFLIDIAFVLLFLVFFLEQRQNKRKSTRLGEPTSLWDRWHFCMILTLLVGVDLGRTCYRTIFLVSFDIQFKKNPPKRYADIAQPQTKSFWGQIQFGLYFIFLLISLVQFVVYEVFFYMLWLQEKQEE